MRVGSMAYSYYFSDFRAHQTRAIISPFSMSCFAFNRNMHRIEKERKIWGAAEGRGP